MTTPKLPPPPRSAQKRSGFSSALARTLLAVGEHDLGREQVVDREPELAGQVAEPAAERQPADAGGRDDPARGREAVLAGRARRPRPRCSRRRRGRSARPGRRRRSLHRREVDDDAVVARAEAAAVVAAAADRERQVVRARRSAIDRGDVVGVGAARDQRRGAGRSSRCRRRAPRRRRRRRGRSARRGSRRAPAGGLAGSDVVLTLPPWSWTLRCRRYAAVGRLS